VTQQHNDCLGRLQQLGVRIAIDDFGTGYSSLNYLTTYPVNRLKIAQQLVFRFDSDARNATVVRAAIRLAHDLGIECIAEGVETQAKPSSSCRPLRARTGCFFSRPVDASRATVAAARARQVRAGYVAGGGDLGGGPETPSSRITAQKVVLNQCITSIMPPYFITIVQVVATKWNPIKY
jgi:predicted signal transduction protein with EAL and GGDEF domain